MSASDQQGTTFVVTAGQLARAQAQRRNIAWGEIERKEQKHLIDMARRTLEVATTR